MFMCLILSPKVIVKGRTVWKWIHRPELRSCWVPDHPFWQHSNGIKLQFSFFLLCTAIRWLWNTTDAYNILTNVYYLYAHTHYWYFLVALEVDQIYVLFWRTQPWFSTNPSLCHLAENVSLNFGPSNKLRSYPLASRKQKRDLLNPSGHSRSRPSRKVTAS